ncbi:PREDICTED: methylated-DNA--protein-cysteine methyltransferase isoform X2 [Rhinopithecus bieti]|nr:PREDICTED: methylated-DNA--protein-cysteine methyltransferase isoform X2 [Rhinopithecus bieti]
MLGLPAPLERFACQRPQVLAVRTVCDLVLGKMDKACEMKRTVLDSPLGKLELSGCEQGLHEIKLLGKGTPKADAMEVPAPAEVLGGPEPLMQCTAWLNAYFHQPEAIEELPVPALHHPVFQQDAVTCPFSRVRAVLCGPRLADPVGCSSCQWTEVRQCVGWWHRGLTGKQF